MAEETIGVAVLVGDVEVEVAVLVVVEPHGADALARIGEPNFRGNVFEASGLVQEERVRTITKGDEQVEIPVRIEVDEGGLAHGARGH